MHWLTIVFIIILAVLLVSLVVLLGFMLTSRPTEVNRLADGPKNELKAKRGQPILNDEYQRKLATMNDDQLLDEVQRIIESIERDFNGGMPLQSSRNLLGFSSHAPPDPSEQENNERAQQLLTTVVQDHGGVVEREHGSGRGIVICAGGFEYGTDALVLIQLLRKRGCELPVEIWHRTDEMCLEMAEEFTKLNCTVRDIDAISSISFPNRFAIKPLAVYYSAFQQVLLLDADNICVADPVEELFDLLSETQPAVFWPDHWPLDKNALCYKTLSSDQLAKLTQTLTQDSGQLLVDRKFCMKALSVCVKINVQLHSQLKRLFPEPFNGGDKDTWAFSWIKTNTPFTMISNRPGSAGIHDAQGQYVGTTLVQYDQNLKPAFLHKIRAKWAKETLRPQWVEYWRFLHPYPRGRVHQWTHRFEDGPVEKARFNQKFGDVEDECWEILNGIRANDWYSKRFATELKDLGM